jgi:hypothetical protein
VVDGEEEKPITDNEKFDELNIIDKDESPQKKK